jgi:hypothetical protein
VIDVLENGFEGRVERDEEGQDTKEMAQATL